MQSDAKKQIPVLVALSLVLLLAVGYSVKKTLSRPVPQEQAAATADSDAPAPAGERTAEARRDDAGLTAEQIVFTGPPARDPFRPVMQPAAAGEPTGGLKIYRAPAGDTPSPGRKRPQGGSGSLSIPPLPLPGLGQGLRVEGPQAQAPAAPEPPPFTATGVVRGSYDLAILRGEGGTRYFVREGQSVGDGYVVKSISPVGVVLKKQDRSVFVKLGGAQDATSTSRPRQEGN